jgi:hypothetical protein
MIQQCLEQLANYYYDYKNFSHFDLIILQEIRKFENVYYLHSNTIDY